MNVVRIEKTNKVLCVVRDGAMMIESERAKKISGGTYALRAQ
jgi:hypothetical protein